MTAQNILDALKLADLSIGLLFSMFGGVAALIVWMMRTRSSVTQELERGDEALAEKFEKELDQVKLEHAELRRVLGQQQEAIVEINVKMATLAHANEIAELRYEFTEFRGEQRRANGQLDVLFRSVLDAREKKSNG